MDFDSAKIKFIIESGNAVSGVSPIPKDNVKPTIDKITEMILDKIGVSEQGVDWDILGGSGKKEKSGDIDIAVLDTKVKTKTGKTVDEAIIDVVDDLNESNKTYEMSYEFLPGFNILSVAFPQYNVGGRSKAKVQVDFMSTDNIEYTKFVFYSPSDKDTFAPAPGIYRTE